jgi:hypothetical protein
MFVSYYSNEEFQVNALMIIVYDEFIAFVLKLSVFFTLIVHEQVDYCLILILVMMLIDAFVVVMCLKKRIEINHNLFWLFTDFIIA